ncbi:MAG: dephospho-CoA kinase [PS1 clade bacterium]|uniref:Dephospho-CoA kinase n=1 Tax=PS1 clade bacterium TaxID=2175152 RepID=A0A937HI61_9PROT|nr:dephospho-CoA kinase [PS1 clade bacterium]
MYLIGLTGSIGMGKSATAKLFMQAGVPVYDADAAVHALYEKGGAAVAPVGELVPEAVVDGAVDRAILGHHVLKDADKLKALEAIVHPLAGQSQFDFLTAAQGAPTAVLDIPLLFETGGDAFVDCVVVVSAPFDIQKQRVLARAGMSEERFNDILAKQVPDEDKRAKADFIVDSSISIEDARTQVRAILQSVEGREGAAYAARLARSKAAQEDAK